MRFQPIRIQFTLAFAIVIAVMSLCIAAILIIISQQISPSISAANPQLQTIPTVLLLLAGLLVVISVAAIWIAWNVSRRLTHPIIHLAQVAEHFSRGDFSPRATVMGSGELSELANAFNHMAAQIQILIESLQAEIRESQAARLQAERSDKIKSAFLASMSHELRTPLNAVINFTKFVARGDLGPVNDQQKEVLEEAVDSAKHLLNLINDVLDMSKIESGSLVLFIEDNVDLRRLISHTVSVGKTMLEEKPVELVVDIDPDLPEVRGDRQRILQILLNIVSNACKFTESGTITIAARRNADCVELSVCDTGPGIARDDQAAVFEAFKQTDSGLRHGGGTGLGMPISRSLAEAHGGRLWLESEFGKGATFYVSLPIQAAIPIPAL